MTGDPGYMQQGFRPLRQGRPRRRSSQAAAKYLGQGRVVVEVVPGKELTITPDPRQAADAAREEMAKQLPPRPPVPPRPRSTTPAADRCPHGGQEPTFHAAADPAGRLSNGTEVLLVEKHELPLVTLHMVFPAGRAEDPPAEPGLAEMTAAVWDEGTAAALGRADRRRAGRHRRRALDRLRLGHHHRAALHPQAAPGQGPGHLRRRAPQPGLSRRRNSSGSGPWPWAG